MSSEGGKRATILATLGQELREMSAAGIMFHQAVADRLGMNVTDHKCADILSRAGPLTAGELAQHTGLTTGAITGVLDRLERAGYVRRVHDPHDRRRVIIEPVLESIGREIGPLFVSLARKSAKLCERYTTKELELILDFIRRSYAMMYEEIRRIRGQEEFAGRK